MYDKQFDFPLTVRVDCINLDYTVDDNFEGEGRSSNASNKSSNISVMTTSPNVSNEMKARIDLVKELKSAVLDLKEDKASETSVDVNTLIDDINKTVGTIEKFEEEKIKLKEKKRTFSKPQLRIKT